MKKILFALISVAFTMAAHAAMPHVYINPGHGGHDADDRNVVVYPFAQGDTAGFWESNSNLKKGFALNNMLHAKGYTTSMSRVSNTTNDDLKLSTIAALSNSSGADIFYSIHSNATGTENRCNYPLGIYRGYTGQPVVAGSDYLAETLGAILIQNGATYWTNNRYPIYGDWSFYPQWGTQGLGVLRGNNVVSMLDEGSFHDYIPETYRLLNDNYCWLEGWNFSRGADSYFGRSDDTFGYGAIAGLLRDSRMLRNVSYECFGDDKRLSLNNATVLLQDLDGNTLDECNTGELYNGFYVFKMVPAGTYRIVARGPEHYEESKVVTLGNNQSAYCNFDLTRVRTTPPQVVSYSPVWHEGDAPLKCSTPIVLNFNWDMDPVSTQAAFVIDPPVEGHFTWEDSYYRMIFEPNDAFEADTRYTVTLKASAEHNGGMALGEDFSFQFQTEARKYIEPYVIFPHDNDRVHYKNALVELRVDSMLVTAYYYDKIHIYNAANEEVAINKRNVKLNKKGDDYGFIRIPIASALNVGEQYRLTISKELVDTAGLRLPQEISYDFTAVDVAQDVDGKDVVNALDAKDDVTATGSTDEATATITAATDYLLGAKSVQVKYELPAGEQIQLDLNSAWTDLTRNDALLVPVNGDVSLNRVAAILREADGTNEVTVDLGVIDFNGWRAMRADLNALPAGKTFVLAALVLMRDNDNKVGQSGTIKIDDPVKEASSTPETKGDVNGDGVVSGADVTSLYSVLLDNQAVMGNPDVNGDGNVSGADVTALYNILLGDAPDNAAVNVNAKPVTDYVVASADGPIYGMELLDATGKTVKRNGGNYINVEDVPAGHYAVIVFTDGAPATRQVTVVH